MFLEKIREAYEKQKDLANLLMDPYFAERIMEAEQGWRRAAAQAVLQSIPLPAITSALSYFDGYRCGNLPANLLQAQRDYFGAHTSVSYTHLDVYKRQPCR